MYPLETFENGKNAPCFEVDMPHKKLIRNLFIQTIKTDKGAEAPQNVKNHLGAETPGVTCSTALHKYSPWSCIWMNTKEYI